MTPIILAITRGLAGLIVCLALISTLACLGGCRGNSEPAAMPDQRLVPVDCSRNPQACA